MADVAIFAIFAEILAFRLHRNAWQPIGDLAEALLDSPGVEPAQDRRRSGQQARRCATASVHGGPVFGGSVEELCASVWTDGSLLRHSDSHYFSPSHPFVLPRPLVPSLDRSLPPRSYAVI